MSDIIANLDRLRLQIPPAVKIIAVSKTKPADDILEAYNAGQRRFGENRVQELLMKKDILPSDIEWHLIGHLQTNKVRFIVPFVKMIHSVDSFKLLSVINSESEKTGKIVDCLLQIHIAEEETKFGFSMRELEELMNSTDLSSLKNIRIRGLMGIATFTSDTIQVRREFKSLKQCFDSLKDKFFSMNSEFDELSMGMSDDYEIAIQEGSTMVRIGSLIFGKRS